MAAPAPVTARPVSADTISAAAGGVRPRRLASIDPLRGAVMVLMALDHVRHFLSDSFAYRPTNLAQNEDAALFLARWVTHFCAPVFVFLAGTSAFLSPLRGQGARALSGSLLTRGLWLIVLELTLVRCLGWNFNFDYHHAMGAVLWALGWSMIALAGLVHLPLRLVAAFGLAMVCLHHLFDGVSTRDLGGWAWLWRILHRPGNIELADGFVFKVAYPLVPWIGVMACGYAFGAVFGWAAPRRRRWMLGLGLALTLGFVLLRSANAYGDPAPWSRQESPLFSALSFVNCTKYPASLLFVMMTLGPALVALALLDGREPGAPGRVLVTFGRVPLFFYLLHLPLIHALAVVLSYARYGEAPWLFENPPLKHSLPEGYGYGLALVCVTWVGVVWMLFPACQAFARFKREHRSRWLALL